MRTSSIALSNAERGALADVRIAEWGHDAVPYGDVITMLTETYRENNE
jgi:hypothetical protein